MKKFNRWCEAKLREAELLLSVGLVLNVIPVVEVDSLLEATKEAWRLLMVNQFHDVLPGSSIEMVHKEAKEWFQECLKLADEVIDRSLYHLGARSVADNTLLNTLPWTRLGLMFQGNDPVSAVTVPPMSLGGSPIEKVDPVHIGNINRNVQIIITKL